MHLIDEEAAAAATSPARVAQLRQLAAKVLGLIAGVKDELDMHAKSAADAPATASADEPKPLLEATTR